jgi:OmpA-OmpF porin, OOP family
MRANRALLLSLVGCACFTAAMSVASGQTQSFSVQRFEPAAGPGNFLGVETARMPEGDWKWSAGLFMNYSLDPFVVQSCVTTTNCSSPSATKVTDTDVVQNMITWDLLASIAPRPWMQFGLRFPLSYVSGQGLDLSTGGPLATPLSAFAAGDPDVEAKFRLYGQPGSPIVIGIAGDLAFVAHSTSSTNFIGDSSPVTGAIRGIIGGDVGKFEYGVNLRGVAREDVTVGINTNAPNTTIGPEFRYSGAGGYNITKVWEVFVEGFGATGFRSEPGTNSLEIDGALRVRPNDTITITGGAGPGVLQGVGVPAVRVFLGVMYAPGDGDRDGDGIKDSVDRCPDEGGNVSRDSDSPRYGCPDHDKDGDLIPDDKDKCPNEPETMNGYQDADGCPDELPDRDKDGIPDAVDKCPDAGGPDVIRDPKSQYYGCPDRDHDGVPDYLDKCPDEPEPTDELWDGSGCPHVRDTDKDGIPDDVDKCPNEPETYNGYQDADGCPDKGPTTVEVTATSINIHDRIEFAVDKDKIQGAKSFQVLDAVAGVLQGHKDIKGIEVQGHTDNTGAADHNRALSQKRAEAVVAYLVSKGVDASRLKAKGYGPDQPLDTNTTAAGRQMNRRVEFHIVGPSAAATPPPTPSAPPPAATPPPATPAPAAAAPPPAAPPTP